MATDDWRSRALSNQGDANTQMAALLVPPLVVFALLVGGWIAITRWVGVSSLILPPPGAVIRVLVSQLSSLLVAAVITSLTAGIGLAGGTILGLGLAISMTVSETVTAIVRPYVIALRIVPVIAIAPLVFLWVGNGVVARALLVMTMTVFPVTVASFAGLCSTPREYLDLAQSVDAAPRDIYLRIRLVSAASTVLAGVKIAAVVSVIGAVVAEFLTLDGGLGTVVFQSSRTLATAKMYAALVVLAVLGLGFYLAPTLVERRLHS